MTQEEFTEKVKEALEEVRPVLQRDGGDVEMIKADLETGQVHLRLMGACYGCPGAIYTLKLGVERVLQRKIPEVKEVVQVL